MPSHHYTCYTYTLYITQVVGSRFAGRFVVVVFLPVMLTWPLLLPGLSGYDVVLRQAAVYSPAWRMVTIKIKNDRKIRSLVIKYQNIVLILAVIWMCSFAYFRSSSGPSGRTIDPNRVKRIIELIGVIPT